ncbi:hypothetical protein GGS24DRAFT_339347 [Hypoxylon argillaceum]|nr:hypothetical protein GGS24DRAFT_339347 [Hypoxylon argillaceum]
MRSCIRQILLLASLPLPLLLLCRKVPRFSLVYVGIIPCYSIATFQYSPIRLLHGRVSIVCMIATRTPLSSSSSSNSVHNSLLYLGLSGAGVAAYRAFLPHLVFLVFLVATYRPTDCMRMYLLSCCRRCCCRCRI